MDRGSAAESRCSADTRDSEVSVERGCASGEGGSHGAVQPARTTCGRGATDAHGDADRSARWLYRCDAVASGSRPGLWRMRILRASRRTGRCDRPRGSTGCSGARDDLLEAPSSARDVVSGGTHRGRPLSARAVMVAHGRSVVTEPTAAVRLVAELDCRSETGSRVWLERSMAHIVRGCESRASSVMKRRRRTRNWTCGLARS